MKYNLLLALMLLTAGCAHTQSPTAEPHDTLVQQQPETPSLDEAIGSLLLVGFRGTQIDSTHHIYRDIRDYHVASVILFDYDAPSGTRGRNIKSPAQLANLCTQLKHLSPSLLIGIDQEGGYVSRLSTRYGFPRIPSAKQSATLGLDSVAQVAHRTAQILNAEGINLNFAPVADVDINPRCPVIGAIERSFSPDADRVGQCCSTWVAEQHKAAIVSCMKHFPGHGSATGDTHKGVVDVTNTWRHEELQPYRTAIADSLPMMVMTAHVVNRQLDPTGLPASLSPRITSLLRDSLGFRGVIVTDDLTMGAIAGQYSLDHTIRLALTAGADLLCLSNNGTSYDPDIVPKAVAIIKQLVADGVVSTDQILRSCQRIRSLAAQ